MKDTTSSFMREYEQKVAAKRKARRTIINSLDMDAIHELDRKERKETQEYRKQHSGPRSW